MANRFCRIGNGDVGGVLPTLLGFGQNFDYFEHGHVEYPFFAGVGLMLMAAGLPRAFGSPLRRRAALAAALPALAGFFWSPGAFGEQAFAAADCTLTDGESEIVAEVLDSVTIRLQSGLVVRLAGIIPPADAATAAAAADALSDLVLGAPAILRYGERNRDRYQRATAQLYLVGSPERWVQSELIAAGLALVSGSADDRTCLAELLAFEREARDAKAGLWQEQAPKDAWSNTIREGGPRFELIEGEVISIGHTERTVYLNFGNNWSVDFTVTMATADAATIEAEGGPFDDLVGRRIRVRGWMEQWDGPWIRVDHAEQIELLD
jgi:micrococcal nuclease